MIVKVFSKQDFVSSMVEQTITDATVDKSADYYICIDSTGGPDSVEYFKDLHANVIRLVFDDVEQDTRMWGNDIQDYYNAVAMTESQAQDLYKFIQTIPKTSTINIHCAKGQSRSVAIASFLQEQEQGNQHVLKLLRQASGLSN
jgi:predicted protein tyrosine phosphatase